MRKLLIFIFLISVFFFSFLPVKDTDFGWHYRCGKEFLKNPKICIDNNFSYYLSDYKSANPHFLYDFILAFIFDRFGFNGLSIFYSLIITLCALIFIKIIPPWWLSILAFNLTFFLSYNTFGLGLRSQIFTYLFFLISLFLLKKFCKNKKFLLFFPFLILIWVNTHIGFFLGLILLLFFIVESLIINKLTSNLWGISYRDRDKMIPLLPFVFFISIIFSLITPFELKIYCKILNHLGSILITIV